MRKMVILVFLLLVLFAEIKRIRASQENANALFLSNIEALASSNEYPDILNCVGTGKLDCPISYDKVKFILGGYGLDE